MNKLILCEGETDAILLNYYLGKVAGWKYSPKPPQNLSIQATAQNEAVNWYKVEASRYISSERLKLKAHLGLTWAVQYPEKVFTKIDEQIRNVRWEESETLHICFSTLAEI
jgi:hypothetical protein